MVTLSGIPVSPGISIGRLQVIQQEEHIIREISLTSGENIRREISQFRTALKRTRKELFTVQKSLRKHLGDSEAGILDAQMHLLSDIAIVDRTISAVRKEKKNAAFIFKRTVEEAVSALEAVKDKYISERTYEIRDIYHRVLNHLLEDFAEGADSIATDDKMILAAKSLPPYEFVHFERGHILGVVTEVGGATSHFSIIARALDIPAVVGCEDLLLQAKTGHRIIIDGSKGLVILNPDRDTLVRYQKLQTRYIEQEQQLLTLKDLKPVTIDGKLIDIAANIELPSEINAVLDHGCRNIGLCRTEFLFMLKNKPPSEEEQYATYRSYLEKMSPGYVIIRTMDIGGDKLALPELHDNTEANPAMGLRAIRLSLEERGLFRTQLRAILRASVHGNLKIMFPMITSLEELKTTLDYFRSVKREIIDEGVPVASHVDVGIMVEVPAAALAAESLAREVDFFSIGTNDLAQFTLAVDRGNKRLAHMYDTLHPSLLKIIKHTVDAAHRGGIWVGVCGEMAGDPLSALLLLGMGVDELSMNSTSVLEIKKIIRSITFDEMRSLVESVLTLETSRQIRLFLQREFRKKIHLSGKLKFMS